MSVCVDRFGEFSAYEGHLKADVVVVACFQVSHKGSDTQAFVVGEVVIVIDGKVYDCEKRKSVNTFRLAYLFYRLVSETETDAETAQRLKNIVIILYQINHLVALLVYLLRLQNHSFSGFVLNSSKISEENTFAQYLKFMIFSTIAL